MQQIYSSLLWQAGPLQTAGKVYAIDPLPLWALSNDLPNEVAAVRINLVLTGWYPAHC